MLTDSKASHHIAFHFNFCVCVCVSLSIYLFISVMDVALYVDCVQDILKVKFTNTRMKTPSFI